MNDVQTYSSRVPRGLLTIIAGPSQSGKTTIKNLLLGKYGSAAGALVTATTRPRREGEVDGVHYHFLSVEEFLRRKNEGGFLETNFFSADGVRGDWYGTPKKEMEEALSQKKIAPRGVGH